ncbi:MAG: tRNA nucleotidyl transferase [Desulfatitalea sp. BRH_c12]|nr:MAG: tRNA nucleotidyl transferase [Desulfatitalea sp. BRH_c12]
MDYYACSRTEADLGTIVTTHKNTDFDALASMVAALMLYPQAEVMVPKQINPNVRAFFSLHKDVFPWMEKPVPDPQQAERLIVVDTSNWDRLSGMTASRKRSDLEILVWDHHPQSTIDATWKCYDTVGANITLMLRCLKAENKRLSPIQATLFLAGLYEDTGQLTFSNTTAEDAYAAGYLLDQGADLKILSKFLRPAYGEKQKGVLFEMLKNARREKINGHTISISKLTVAGHVDGLALVVGMYRDIMNVDAAFGVFYIPDNERCMVIGRSDVEGLHIGDIMRGMGGGGHPGAGSAMLRQVNPDAVVEMICGLIGGNQQASVQISDLMSFPVHTVNPDMPMTDAAKLMRSKGCTGLPVAEDGKLVGMISRRDFQKLRKDSQLKAPVKAYMRYPVETIDPGKSPLQAARIMIRQDIGRLPVVEEDRLIGIVTRSDVMCYFYDLLPE